MRSTIDMAPFARSTIGYDRLLDHLEAFSDSEPVDNYPPYNIERLGDDRYRIALAVAGYSVDELDVTVEANQLAVSASKAVAEEKDFLHRGISHHPFVRRFSLADYVVVKDAKLANGLLTIELERQLPESKKPKRIAIDAQMASLESKRAA